MNNDEKLAEAHMSSVEEAARSVIEPTLAAGGGPVEVMVVLESMCLRVGQVLGVRQEAFVPQPAKVPGTV
jgi:hypothetical protein